MKARREQEKEHPKMTRRTSDPVQPCASRSASLRNELLHSIRNNTKLKKLEEEQQRQRKQEVKPATESAPVSPLYHIQTATDDVAPIQQIHQSQPNHAPAYLPPSGPPSPTYHPTSHVSLHHSTSNESTGSLNVYQQSLLVRQKFSLSKLPTPRLALLTGSKKLISRLGQLPPPDQPDPDFGVSPVCYLLDNPANLQELTIDTTEHLHGHILVCMHHKVSNIFKFIYNLR